MKVSSLLQYLRQQGITVKNKKKIEEKVAAWLKLQMTPLLCLTTEAEGTLETLFTTLHIPAGKISQLIGQIAQKTLFPQAPGPVEKLQALIDHPKATLADYQSLLEVADALRDFVQGFTNNRAFFWLQEKHRELRQNNPLITTEPDAESHTHELYLWLNIYGTNRAVHVLVDYLRRFFTETPPPENALNPLNKLKIDEEVQKTLLLSDVMFNDPEVHQFIEHMMATQELVSVEVHFQELIDAPVRNALHFSKEIIDLCRCLLPVPPKYTAFMRPDAPEFDLYNPYDASAIFQELEETYRPYAPTLLSTYQLILERMDAIKKVLTAHTLPAPLANVEEFKHQVNQITDFHFQTDFSRTRERLEAMLPATILSLIDQVSSLESVPLESPQQPLEVLLQESSPFPVSGRLLKWFDPHTDPFATEKKYLNLPEGKKEEVHFLHNFAWIINHIAHTFGHTTLRKNSQGIEEKMITLAIQAETPFSPTPVNYILTITFDAAGTVYHRTLTQKSQGSLVYKLLKRGFFEREFPPLPSQTEELAIHEPWLHTQAPDRSYVLKVDGKVIVVADPKWPLPSGKPTLLYVMAV